MAFHQFLRAAIQEKEIRVYGDGSQTRDFTFVSDAVDATLSALKQSGLEGETFNIGGGERVSLRDALRLIEAVAGKRIHLTYEEGQKGDMRDTHADISKAREMLSYKPHTPLREGLRLEYEWLLPNLQEGEGTGS